MINIMNIFMIIFLVIGAVYSFYISQRFYLPISNVVGMLNSRSDNLPRGKKVSEIEFIKENIVRITLNNETLEGTIHTSIPFFVDLMCFKLVTGDKDLSIINEVKKEYDITLGFNLFFATVFKTDVVVEETDNDLRSIVKRQIGENLLSFLKMKEDEYVILTKVESKEKCDGIVKKYEELLGCLDDSFGKTYFYIGIGKVVKDIKDIRQSYKNALLNIRNRKTTETVCIVDSDVKKLDYINNSLIPYDMEHKLIKLLTSSDIKKSMNYIEGILDKYYKEGLSFISYYKACICIQSVIFRVGIEYDGSGNLQDKLRTIDNIEGENNFLLLKEKIADNVNLICGHFTDKKSKTDKMKYVIDYIDDNYDKDINMGAVADEFNFNPSYFSRIFKQNEGLSFTDYLNNKRIEKAGELIKNTDKRIKEIAEMVGYNSTDMFIRVFKKHKGVSPGKYRDINVIKINRNEQ